MAAFTGLAVLGVGTTAAALVGLHSTPALASSVCQALPSGPSSPPPGPTSSITPSGAASPSAAAAATSTAATQLCVTVAAVTSTVQPGHPAQYKIDVQPTGGVVGDVTVQISATPSSFPAPTFTVCGAGDGTHTCALGTMRATQKIELQAQDAVPGSASSGDSVTLTAKVTGVASGATAQGYVSGIASVRVVAPPPSSPPPTKSPSPQHSGHSHRHGSGSGNRDSGDHSGGSGSNQGSGLGTGLGPSGGNTSLGSDLSPLTGLAGGGSGADPSNLFPTISPSPGASPGTSAPRATSSHDPYHPTSVADVLPLNPRQLGSQVAGLVVLALGIIIAVVRVSVRKPRTQDKQ